MQCICSRYLGKLQQYYIICRNVEIFKIFFFQRAQLCEWKIKNLLEYSGILVFLKWNLQN
jgi:hypothetical protein